MRKRILTGAVILGIAVVIVVCAYWLIPVIGIVVTLDRKIEKSEKHLLYHTDHTTLAAELRALADERWRNWDTSSDPVVIDGQSLPAALKSVEPIAVVIYSDRALLQCGSPFLHFGVTLFKDPQLGSGLRELAPGMWFYADNGKVPQRN